MRKSIVVLSLGLILASVAAAPAAGGAGGHARRVPKAMRLAAVDTGTSTTPTGTLHFAYRHGSMVCFGRFTRLDPGVQYQFQWGAQDTTPTSFTANRRGCAKFRTTTVPTDPTSGQYQASVTDGVGTPALYCDWDAMIFCRTPPVVGTGTPPDPTTTPPTTTPPDPTTPPSTPPQGGTSPWRGGMGCGWR